MMDWQPSLQPTDSSQIEKECYSHGHFACEELYSFVDGDYNPLISFCMYVLSGMGGFVVCQLSKHMLPIPFRVGPKFGQ